MKLSLYKRQIIMFIVMVIIGMLFNPMNILAHKFSDLYISQTLFYGGLLMASNMVWAHEIVHYLSIGHFNMLVFSVGIILSICVSILLLRQQLLVDDKQWLRRMIGHHSTAITTTKQLLKKRHIMGKNTQLYRLAKDIVYNQEREILFMKTML
jgi:hypothetical protein|tara:strand:- start:342 stop:800 length:459 start_codon:yes stop_codon:yes gene_type:complete